MAAQVGESECPAVERLQGERRRELIAERNDPKLGQQIVDCLVRRGRGPEPEAGRQKREGETTA